MFGSGREGYRDVRAVELPRREVRDQCSSGTAHCSGQTSPGIHGSSPMVAGVHVLNRIAGCSYESFPDSRIGRAALLYSLARFVEVGRYA